MNARVPQAGSAIVQFAFIGEQRHIDQIGSLVRRALDEIVRKAGIYCSFRVVLELHGDDSRYWSDLTLLYEGEKDGSVVFSWCERPDSPVFFVKLFRPLRGFDNRRNFYEAIDSAMDALYNPQPPAEKSESHSSNSAAINAPSADEVFREMHRRHMVDHLGFFDRRHVVDVLDEKFGMNGREAQSWIDKSVARRDINRAGPGTLQLAFKWERFFADTPKASVTEKEPSDSDPQPQSLGERLKAFRQRYGYTPAYVAAMAEISRGAVINAERGGASQARIIEALEMVLREHQK